MKLTKLPLALLMLFVFACDEQVRDTSPNPDASEVLLTRIEIGSPGMSVPRAIEFTYEDGLLTRQTNGRSGTETSYFYEGEVLVREELLFSDEQLETKEYTYGENRLLVDRTITKSGEVASVSQFEYLLENEALMRVNTYIVRDGTPELGGYSLCDLENGNVVHETHFSPDGVQSESTNSAEFTTGLNPLALFKGHPSILNTNVKSASRIENAGELVIARLYTNYQYNEYNLPVERNEMVLVNQDSISRVYRYFYQEQ